MTGVQTCALPIWASFFFMEESFFIEVDFKSDRERLTEFLFSGSKLPKGFLCVILEEVSAKLLFVLGTP